MRGHCNHSFFTFFFCVTVQYFLAVLLLSKQVPNGCKASDHTCIKGKERTERRQGRRKRSIGVSNGINSNIFPLQHAVFPRKTETPSSCLETTASPRHSYYSTFSPQPSSVRPSRQNDTRRRGNKRHCATFPVPVPQTRHHRSLARI